MLQQDEPDDYVIATGECYSVKQFLEAAFKCVDIDPYEYLETDQTFFRPSEVFLLQGDATKARQNLDGRMNYLFRI
jgi:GDPmannose 4,6-dehydratase